MEWHVRAFLKASLTWLALGVTFGVAMAGHPAWTVYRPAHLHMTLLGFVTMMIYGVGYHVFPRFAGFPLHARRLPAWHWWASNTGLSLMVVGFVLRGSGATSVALSTGILTAGGTLSALGAYAFAYNIWRTIDGPRAMRRAARVAGERTADPRAVKLPVASPPRDG